MATATHISHHDGSWLRRRGPAVQFVAHYLEMVLVMLVGMLVLGGAMLLAAAALGAGRSEIRADAPAAFLAGMGVSMILPMVWWMARRGHSRAANGAMALAMALPTALAVALLAAGAMTDLDELLTVQHVLMFPGMFVAMVPFRREFVH